MRERLGNGLTRMIPWNVAKAVNRCGKLINKLGPNTFISEARTALVLGCTLLELNNLRIWKKIDLGIKIRQGKPSMHYENNGLNFYYQFQNLTNGFEVTTPLVAVLAHNIRDIIGSDTGRVSSAVICDQLASRKPWNQWNKIKGGQSEVRPMTPTSLNYALKTEGIKPSGRPRGLSLDDLAPLLDRYPAVPKLDPTKYTREAYYLPVDVVRNEQGPYNPIHYRLGDIADYLADPWPVLIDRVGRSNRETIYCLRSPDWKDGLVKIGMSGTRESYTYRMVDYRASEKFPGDPIVHWAVEVPTRIVLEKRLHNLYLPRQRDSVGAGKAGGEMFWSSPSRWSPERMLRDAVSILDDTGSKYTVLDVDPITYEV